MQSLHSLGQFVAKLASKDSNCANSSFQLNTAQLSHFYASMTLYEYCANLR